MTEPKAKNDLLFWSLIALYAILLLAFSLTGTHASFARNLLAALVPSASLTVLAAPLAWAYHRSLALHWKILLAMACSALATELLRRLKCNPAILFPLGTLFINLLKMVIVPLVVSSIISGVASLGNPRQLGRLGGKTLLYYMSTSLVAILIGLALMNLIRPGHGLEISETARAVDPASLKKPGSVWEILIRMVPSNPVHAAVEGDMLALIFFSLALGLALTTLAAKHRDALLPVIEAGFQAMMRLTEGIIQLAPIGVFGLIAKAYWDLPFSSIMRLMVYFLTVAAGLLIHLLIVLPLLIRLLGKRSPLQHYRHIQAAMITAFSTSSSSATLPVTMECVEKNAGVSNRICSFTLPLGATVNMDGTALYECAGVLFIAQVLAFPLSLGQQAVVVLTALLASIGAAGIPSSGLVMIFIVLEAVGLQGPEVNALVGVMLAIDRPLDMLRTVVNITSDTVGALFVARTENELSEPAEDR
jgi:DAACS family dicarboxylate/amino acid:cation (Na+ or H+) symporter